MNLLARSSSGLDINVPREKLTKQTIQSKNKSWTILGTRNSVSIENILLTKYIKLKDLAYKNELQIRYVPHGKSLSILLKQSEIFMYCTNFFENNLENYMRRYNKIPTSTYLPKSHAPTNLSILSFIKV